VDAAVERGARGGTDYTAIAGERSGLSGDQCIGALERGGNEGIQRPDLDDVPAGAGIKRPCAERGARIMSSIAVFAGRRVAGYCPQMACPCSRKRLRWSARQLATYPANTVHPGVGGAMLAA